MKNQVFKDLLDQIIGWIFCWLIVCWLWLHIWFKMHMIYRWHSCSWVMGIVALSLTQFVNFVESFDIRGDIYAFIFSCVCLFLICFVFSSFSTWVASPLIFFSNTFFFERQEILALLKNRMIRRNGFWNRKLVLCGWGDQLYKKVEKYQDGCVIARFLLSWTCELRSNLIHVEGD